MLEDVKKQLSIIAPSILKALQPGAEESKIQELQELIGQALPEDMINLYRTCNGNNPKTYSNFAYGVEFINIQRCIDHITSYLKSEYNCPIQHTDPEIKNEYLEGKLRVPIGDDNGTSLICVDLDPSEKGKYGQVILIDYKMGISLKLADSVTDYINRFARDLKAGKYSLQEDALEDGVEWLDPISEIDPINWFNSPTWSYVNQ